MNNFFPAMNMYRYPKSNVYIPPPDYKINPNPNFYDRKETIATDNHNTYNKSDNIDNKSKQDDAKEKRNHLTEKPLFEFHGIQLYNDDILILLLIFFLYKEHVNDMLLLIALFSLLF